MFGSKAPSLPSPFSADHRHQRLYSESARPQPSGQCHFRILHAGSNEQRCPCQCYQHNRSAPGNVCDCTHAACYHAQTVQNDKSYLHEDTMNNAGQMSSLVDRIRKLEDTVQAERDLREKLLIKERQAWEREIRTLRETLSGSYKHDEDMRQRLREIHDKLERTTQDQTHIKSRIMSIEDASMAPHCRVPGRATDHSPARQLLKHKVNGHGPSDVTALYLGSEGRTSPSAEPLSPRQSTTIPPEQESPRSSGILNLVELPRAALSRLNLPPRLSPPAEMDEPRSSGFLALDVKELINRRKAASCISPARAYNSPASTATKSPGFTGRITPQSLPRISPPHVHNNSSVGNDEDRTYKKRKHQGGLMALDVLANVSAASPVMS